MDATMMYPRKCRKNIRIIMNEVGTSVETAYAMLLMTSLLMDMNPEDDEVLHIVLQDCGVEDGDIF